MRSRLVRGVWSATILGCLGYAGASGAEPSVPDLQGIAVTVQRMPTRSWAGYGIYLGDGLIITAAHVAGHGILTQPYVVFAGQSLPTTTVKEGSYPDNDLAILRLTPPLPPELAQRHTPLCPDPPRPGEAVMVATPEKVTTSVVIAPDVLPPDLRTKYAASIKDVYTTGNSGSGVFDTEHKCLLGIMSSKIEQHLRLIVNGEPVIRTIGVAKHFVPSTDIKAFVAGVLPP